MNQKENPDAQDAKFRAKWKARLISWCDDLSEALSRPVVKLVAETVFGILASGSLRQSEIARALKEPCRLHHTQKRLSRMLARHSEIGWAAEQLQLERIAPHITEDRLVASQRCRTWWRWPAWLGRCWPPIRTGRRSRCSRPDDRSDQRGCHFHSIACSRGGNACSPRAGRYSTTSGGALTGTEGRIQDLFTSAGGLCR
jgi:hypothetical protein